MTLLEAVVALVVLGAVVAAIIPVLSRTSMVREQVDRREVALHALSNLLERAAILPERTEDRLRATALELLPDGQLPQPEWKITVQSDEPTLQRVEAELSWQHHDQARSSLSLVRWYPGGRP